MANVAQLGVGIRNDAGPGSRAFANDAARVGRAARKASGDVRNLQHKMTTAGKASAGAGAQIMKAFGVLGGVMVIASATRAIAEFEETMAVAGKVARASGEQFAKMQEQAKMLGATTRFTASEAADGLLFLGRAGFDAEEAMAALPSTLNLAAAGVMGLGEAADLASNVVKQFGLEADSTVRVVDALLIVSNRANTSVTQLGEAMKYAGPVAGALGLSVEQTAAAMGALGDAGIQSSMAGTNLRGVMAGLLGPTSKAAAALDGMKLSVKDLDLQADGIVGTFEKLAAGGMTASDAVAIFGRRNAAAALVLAASTEKMHELEMATRLNRGEAEEMARVMDNTLGGSLRALKSSFEGLMLATGDAGFTGSLRAIVDTVTGVLRVFAGMQSSVDKNRGLILGLATVIEVLVIRFVALKAMALMSWFGSLATSIYGAAAAARATAGSVGALGAAVTAAGGPITVIATALAVVIAMFRSSSRAAEEYTNRLKELNAAQTAADETARRLAQSDTYEQRLGGQIALLRTLHENVGKAYNLRQNTEEWKSFWSGATGQGFSINPAIFDQLWAAYQNTDKHTTEWLNANRELQDSISAMATGVGNAVGDIVNRMEELPDAAKSVEDLQNRIAAADLGDTTKPIEERAKALQALIAEEREYLLTIGEISQVRERIAQTMESTNPDIAGGVFLDDFSAGIAGLKTIDDLLGEGNLSPEALDERSRILSELSSLLQEFNREQGGGGEVSDALLLEDALSRQLRTLEMTTQEKRLAGAMSKLIKEADIEVTEENKEILALMEQRLATALGLRDASVAQASVDKSVADMLRSMEEQNEITTLLLQNKKEDAAVTEAMHRAEALLRRQNANIVGEQVTLTDKQRSAIEEATRALFQQNAALREQQKLTSATGDDRPTTPQGAVDFVIEAQASQVSELNTELQILNTTLDLLKSGASESTIEQQVREIEMIAQSQMRLEQMKADAQALLPEGTELTNDMIQQLEAENARIDDQAAAIGRVTDATRTWNDQRDLTVSSMDDMRAKLAEINGENSRLEATLTGTTAATERQIAMDQMLAFAKLALNAATAEEKEEMLALLDGFGAAQAKQAELLEQQKEMQATIAIINRIGDSFADMVFDIVDGSKSAEEAIGGFLRAIGEMILKQMMAAMVTKMLKTAMGIPFADGGVIAGGQQVTKYASGGIVHRPTIFPMADGIGLMGEEGPEAIMPLKRGRNGKLGVEVADGQGGGGGTKVVNVNMTVNTPDANSFRRSRRQISDAMRKAQAGV